MDILILTRKPEIYSSMRLAEEASRAGHMAKLMGPEDTDMDKQTPHLIIPRFGLFRFTEALFCLNYFEKKRIPSLNSSLSYRDARNKWFAYLHLDEAGLPTPPSRALYKQDLVSQPPPFPFIIKPLEGAKGEGIRLIQNKSDLISLPADEELLWQKYIAEANNCDLRLFVVANEVVAAIERHAPAGDFRSNLSIGGHANKITPTPYEIEIAVKATQTLKLDYAGVDIIRSKDGPLILELNPCPGLEGVEKYSGVNIAEILIKLAEKKVLKPTTN